MAEIAPRAVVTAEDVARILDEARGLLAEGRAGEASERLDGLVAAVPDDHRPLILSAEALRLLSRYEEARARAARAVVLAPWEPSGWVVLAEVVAALGDKEEALAAFLEALAAGDSPMAAHRAARFAIAHGLADRLREALSAVERERAPTRAEIWCLALLALHFGDAVEAAGLYEVAFFDEDVEAPLDLALGAFDVVREAGSKEFALALIDRCLRKHPDRPDVLFRKAILLREMERTAEAMGILKDVLDRLQGEEQATALVNLAHLHSRQGEHAEALELLRRYEASEHGKSFPLLIMAISIYAYASEDAEKLREVADWIGEAARKTPSLPLLVRNPNPKRIRVGLLSNGFGRHPVGWLTLAAFEGLDRERFSLYCFETDGRRDDPLRARFRVISEEFVELNRSDTSASIRKIQSRGLDILIDLQGYSAKAISGIVLAKAAPVQVKWVGMQAYSSGLPTMDAMVTDNIETPPGFEKYYSEKLLRLSRSYICYTPPEYIPDITPLPSERNGYVTFGYFNNLQKMSDRWLAATARILQHIPDARLVLKTRGLNDPPTRARFEKRLTAFGIDPSRCEFQGMTEHASHLRAIADVDIALDAFPYSGGLTTLECALMGVPVVSVAGTSFSSRHSLSHLTWLGVPELCGETDEHYVATAVSLAQSPDRLRRYRDELRDRLLRTSGLCDGRRVGAELGKALEAALAEATDTRPRCSLMTLSEIEAVHPEPRIREWRALVSEERARDPAALDTPFALASDAALALLAMLERHRPRRILELGSGLSTLLLARQADRLGIEEIVSVDDNAAWQTRIEALLPPGCRVRLLTLPLAPTSWGGASGVFYEGLGAALGDGWMADAVLIDGPRGDLGGPAMRNRAMAAEVIGRHARRGALLMLDDAWRFPELDAAALWSRHSLVEDWTLLDTERGFGFGRVSSA